MERIDSLIKVKKWQVVYFLMSLWCASSYAQSEFDLAALKKKYPNFALYHLNDIGNVRVYFENDSIKIGYEVISESLTLNDKATLFSEKVISYYTEMESISDIQASCYVPQDNGKLKRFKIDDIKSRKASKGSVFYDDLNEFYFSYPGLKEGSVIQSKYIQTLRDVHFLTPFYLANYFPTGLTSFTITYPKNVKVNYLVKGDTTGLVTTRTESKNEITINWKIQNQRPFNDEREEGTWGELAPRILPYVASYEYKGKNVALLENTAGLYHWYYTHIKDLVNANSSVVQNLADSITKNCKSEIEKVKTVYYWVQENTKYIAFENGLGGFIPRPAELVCNRRYGDCKDKSSLIYALLKASGVKSYFTWIGTRDIPYTYEECPTPMTDNHMIISYLDHGKWQFLDGTANGISYGYPTSFIQGKEALISISPDSFVVTQVPILDKEVNFMNDSLNVKIVGNDLTGTGATTYGGYWKYDMSYRWYSMAEKDRVKEMSDEFKFVNNKTIVDSLNWKMVDTIADDCTFLYKIKLPNYSKSVDKKMYVNLNLRRDFQGEYFDTLKQKTDVEFRYKFSQKQITVFNIPDGYKITKIPGNVVFSKDAVAINVHYKLDGNKVIMEGVLSYDDMYKRRNKYEIWNEFIKHLDDAYTQVLVLEKI
jgi:transglutaminase-like putative cysteine protease